MTIDLNFPMNQNDRPMYGEALVKSVDRLTQKTVGTAAIGTVQLALTLAKLAKKIFGTVFSRRAKNPTIATQSRRAQLLGEAQTYRVRDLKRIANSQPIDNYHCERAIHFIDALEARTNGQIDLDKGMAIDNFLLHKTVDETGVSKYAVIDLKSERVLIECEVSQAGEVTFKTVPPRSTDLDSFTKFTDKLSAKLGIDSQLISTKNLQRDLTLVDKSIQSLVEQSEKLLELPEKTIDDKLQLQEEIQNLQGRDLDLTRRLELLATSIEKVKDNPLQYNLLQAKLRDIFAKVEKYNGNIEAGKSNLKIETVAVPNSLNLAPIGTSNSTESNSISAEIEADDLTSGDISEELSLS
jgi:hypothetical protein